MNEQVKEQSTDVSFLRQISNPGDAANWRTYQSHSIFLSLGVLICKKEAVFLNWRWSLRHIPAPFFFFTSSDFHTVYINQVQNTVVCNSEEHHRYKNFSKSSKEDSKERKELNWFKNWNKVSKTQPRDFLIHTQITKHMPSQYATKLTAYTLVIITAPSYWAIYMHCLNQPSNPMRWELLWSHFSDKKTEVKENQ